MSVELFKHWSTEYSHGKFSPAKIIQISRSEEFHFGDLLDLTGGEIKPTLYQTELNIGKPGKLLKL